MSYNLTTQLLKAKKEKNFGKKENYFLLEEDDYTFNVENIHFVVPEKMALVLKNVFKDYVQRLPVEVYDHSENLKKHTETPDRYTRLDLFEDTVSYVDKSLLKKHGAEYIAEHVYDFTNQEVIYIFDAPQIVAKEKEVIVFDQEDGEWTAAYMDRMTYHSFLPEPVNEYNECWLLSHKADFDRYKVVNDFGDDKRPAEKWEFIEGQHLVMVEK